MAFKLSFEFRIPGKTTAERQENREKLILISSIGSLVLGIMFASDYLPYAVAIAAVCFVLIEIYRHLPILRKRHDE